MRICNFSWPIEIRGAGRGNRTPITSLEGWGNSLYTIPAKIFFTKLLSVEIKRPTTDVQRMFPRRCFDTPGTIVRAILFVNRSRPVL